MNKISGVYKITNNVTGDFYIGSSKNIMSRWYCHKCKSSWDYRPRSQLYIAMQKYGLENFKFEVLEETDTPKEREQYWIDELKPSYNDRRAEGQDVERYVETYRRSNKEYQSRLCLYNSETLTLNALSQRFRNRGILHATLEAKKYLLNK